MDTAAWPSGGVTIYVRRAVNCHEALDAVYREALNKVCCEASYLRAAAGLHAIHESDSPAGAPASPALGAHQSDKQSAVAAWLLASHGTHPAPAVRQSLIQCSTARAACPLIRLSSTKVTTRT